MSHLLRPLQTIVLSFLMVWAFVWPLTSQAQSEQQLWHAAAFGDLTEVQSAVEHGANVNFRGPGGFTAINAAARNGHLEIVQYLVEHGANIDESDNNREKTALLAASFKGHFDIVKYLVGKGANVNAQSINGFTPLHDAAFVGNLEIVQFLVEHGADVNIRNKHNQTALETAREGSHRAAEHGRTNATSEDYEKVIDYLKARGG